VSAEGVERLREAYDAFKRQDIPAVMAAFDEQIEWNSPANLPMGGIYRGHEGVGEFFGQLPQHWQELSVEPEEFIDAGEVIVVPIHLRGKGAGGSVDTWSLHLWRMRGDRAVSFREYADTASVLQALGQPVSASA